MKDSQFFPWKDAELGGISMDLCQMKGESVMFLGLNHFISFLFISHFHVCDLMIFDLQARRFLFVLALAGVRLTMPSNGLQRV